MTETSESKAERRQLQEKINKQYIDSKVHPIIEPMATALFSEAGPHDDPVSMPSPIECLDRIHAQIHEAELW